VNNAGASMRRLSLVQSMEECMRQSQGCRRAILLAGLLAAIGASHAQTQGENPDRQASLRTLQKEIGAAYEEAKKACGGSGAAERGACLKEARATYEREMKKAPAQLGAAPGGSVETTVQKTVGTTTSTTTTQTTR
jgi:hypothetical protein